MHLRMLPPTGLIHDYARELWVLIGGIRPAVVERMDGPRENERRQAQRDYQRAAKAEALAIRYSNLTAKQQRYQLDQVIKATTGQEPIRIGRDLAPRIKELAKENASLITGVTKAAADAVARASLDALRSGKSGKSLEDDIRRILKDPQRNVVAIAKDQLTKLSSQLNRERQLAMGVTQFIWMSMEDDHVRPEHVERHGKTYDYDDPPDGEYPGEPIGCRCWGLPVIVNEDNDS